MSISEQDSQEIRELYAEAETAIQLIEPRWEGLAIASINQLRYAGHDFISACSEAIVEKSREHLVQARRQCQRAIYDAYDGGLILVLTDIARFQKDYRGIDIAAYVPDYPKIRQAARDAKELLHANRENGRGRQIYYKKASETYKRLEVMSESLEAARGLLNKALTKQNRDTRMYWVRIGLIVASVSLSVAAAARLLMPLWS